MLTILVGETATVPLITVDRLEREMPGVSVPPGGSIVTTSAMIEARLAADGMSVVIDGIELGEGAVIYTGPLGETTLQVEVVAAVPFAVRFAVDKATYAATPPRAQ